MKLFRLYMLFLIMLPLFSIYAESNAKIPKAKHGIMDLRQWNFNKKGAINLNGEWEFYWNEFIPPSDFNTNYKDSAEYCIKVPGLWNSKKFDLLKYGTNSQDISLPERLKRKYSRGDGYATLKLKVLLPDSCEIFACKIGRIETAYKLFINGHEYMSNGITGKSKNEMKPQWKPSTFHFKADTNVIEFVLQISNFYHKKGGVSHPILLGNPTQISIEKSKKTGFELFVLGVLFIMAVYHFSLFILRKKDASPLYFGLFCLFTGLHLLVNGEVQLSGFFPKLPWEIILKINFLNNYLRVPVFVLFIASLFKDEVSVFVKKSFIYIFSFFTLLILFTHAKLYTHTLIPVEFVIISGIIYLIYILFKVALKKRIEAIFSIIGTFVIMIAAINDILHENMVIQTAYIIPIGLFIFIFFQSFMLSIFSSKAYKSIENLTGRLLKLDKIKNEFLACSSYSLSSPLKILMENIGVDRGLLLLKKNGKWVIEAKKIFPDLEAKGSINIELDFDGGRINKPLLSEKIVRKVIKTHENVLINKPFNLELYSDDPYIIENKPHSVYCMPLINHNTLKGILYLEMNTSDSNFTEEQLKILDLLSSQVATLIDNAEIFWELETLNRNLEKKVEERTQEIILQKEEILAQRDEIEDKNKILQQAYNEITVKNRDITDSIHYAKRIQTSVLPPSTFVKEIVPESFILFKPKDILSGDFYWVEKYTSQMKSPLLENFKSEFVIAAAVDCTGHGVPGALLSIMGYNLINNIINENKYTKPSEILNILQTGVRNYLRQNDEDMQSKDGMDIALISYEKNSKKLQFAGARNPLFLIRNGELTKIKGDRQSIGGFISKKYRGKSFTNHEIIIEKDDLIYIFSDGYADQFGGPDNLKFSSQAFGNLLISIYKKPLEEQKQILIETLDNWKTGQKQIDDILVMGFKFSSIK